MATSMSGGRSKPKPKDYSKAGAAAGRNWGRGAAKGVAVFAVFVMFSGLIVYSYNKGKEAGGGGTPPIIKAGPAPYKVRPERPGGMQVPDRDKQVYSRIDGAPRAPVVERLLPPAETPIAPTVMAPAAMTPTVIAPTAMAPTAAPALAPPALAAPRAPAPETPAGRPKRDATAPAKPVASASARRLAKIAPASGGDFKIQLASLRSNVAVAQSWKRLVKSNKDLLGGLRLTIVRRDLGSAKGVYFRMHAGPMADAVAARDLCARLKRRKLSCLVVRP